MLAVFFIGLLIFASLWVRWPWHERDCGSSREWPGRPAATRLIRTSREQRMVEQKQGIVVKRIRSANMD